MRPRIITVALVLLVGAGLFWLVAAGSGDPDSDQRPTTPLEKGAVRLERKLVEDPRDKKLLLALTHAWIEAGNERLSRIDVAGEEPIPAFVPEDYRAGLRAWNRYLRETGGKAAADDAEMAGATFFSLIEIGSTDPAELRANAAGAARAQKLVCRQDPNLLTLSLLVQYAYFNDEFAVGDKAARAAEAYGEGPNLKFVRLQLRELRERGERFLAKASRAERILEESGEEELEVPLKGFANAAGINRTEEDDPYG